MKKPVSEAKLDLSSDTTSLGQVVKAEVSVPGAKGLHAFRIEIDSPPQPWPPTSGAFFPRCGYPVDVAEKDAENPDWSRRVVLAGAEPVTFDIPIAYNDPVGTYKVTVTELFSDKSVSRELQVQRKIKDIFGHGFHG